MDDQKKARNAAGRNRRRIPWVYLALAAILISAIVWARLQADADTDIDQGIVNMTTYFGGTLLVLLSAIWFAARSRSRPWVRLAPLFVIGAGAAVFFSIYRLDGWSGALAPRFVRRGADSAPLPVSSDLRASSRPGDLAVQPVATSAHDFPWFLGPAADQEINSVALERNWEASPPELVWRRPVGAGWSGFSVVGTYAVTQEQRDEGEAVICYELSTGEPQWAHIDEGVKHGTPGSFGGVGPRATPTLYGGRAFTVGATGILNAIELATGRLLWSHNIIEESGAPMPSWGKANSPLIVDDLVVVSAGGPDGKSLIAYKQSDGTRAWSAGDDIASYATPALAELCGIRQILSVNQDWVAGHDAVSGRVLWRFPWEGNTDRDGSASQPRVIGENRVFVSKGYARGAALFQLDAAAVQQAVESGESTAAKRIWDRQTNGRAVLKTKLSNVCIREGFAYGLDELILQCAEIATGKQRWKRGRYGQGQLLLIGDLLLVQTEDGRIVLVEANPSQHVELASFQAIEGEPCWNCPALAGPYLLVRNKYEAACYKLPLAQGAE